MKVLVTGATGLIGGYLIKALQRRGEHIRTLVLPVENTEKLEAQGIEVVKGDITDASSLGPAIKDIDIVLNLAGMMGVWRPIADYRLVNVTGATNLHKAAQSANVRRFVHITSHVVYGLGHGRFLTEDAPLQPDPDPYCISKAEGDHLMRRLMHESDMETVVLRPGTIFGPNDRLHFGRMAERLKAGRGLLVGKGDNAFPFCYVTDAVEGFLLAAYHKNAPGNTYNISNDRPLTTREIFNAIADDVDGKHPKIHLPYLPLLYGSIAAEKFALLTHTKPIVTRVGVLMLGTDNRHSIEKARRELGYEPKIDIREGIRLSAEWFNAGGMEQPFVTQASQYAPLAGGRK